MKIYTTKERKKKWQNSVRIFGDVNKVKKLFFKCLTLSDTEKLRETTFKIKRLF